MKRFASRITSIVLLGMFALMLSFVATPMVAQTTSASALTCTQHAILDNVTATTKVISAPATTSTTININGTPTTVTTTSKKIRLCSVSYRINQTTGAANYGLKTGTGTNCGTGTANYSPQWVGTASVKETLLLNYNSDGALIVPSGVDLCFALSAAPTQAQIEIAYSVY